MDQIVSLVEERYHPDEFGKAATGEAMLQATVRLIGWEATQRLLARKENVKENVKYLIQREEEWRRNALAARAISSAAEPGELKFIKEK